MRQRGNCVRRKKIQFIGKEENSGEKQKGTIIFCETVQIDSLLCRIWSDEGAIFMRLAHFLLLYDRFLRCGI